jgi:hypothetical protein
MVRTKRDGGGGSQRPEWLSIKDDDDDFDFTIKK